MIARIVLFVLFILSILLCLQLPFMLVLVALDGIWDWGLPNMERWGQTSLVMAIFGFFSCFLIAPIWAHVEEYL